MKRETKRERVLLKCRVVKGYEFLSLEQIRHTRGGEENKQNNQMEIPQFLDFFISVGKTRVSELLQTFFVNSDLFFFQSDLLL